MQPNVAPTAPLYTELPYPGDGVVRTTMARMLQPGLSRHAPHLLKRDPLWIADIGCGTGEAVCGVAKWFPRAHIVGVDINPASLDLAQKLANRHRLNAMFVRANITEDLAAAIRAAGGLPPGGGFDVITSFGVLHHLREPEAGFARVRELIANDGLFLCHIYSRQGRREDLAARTILDRAVPVDRFAERADAINLLRLSRKHSLGSFFRQLRNRLRFGPPLTPIELLKVRFKRNNLVHLSDTFSNPCEHLYLFGDLREVCERAGWTVIGLAERGGLPVTPEDHTRDPRTLALLRTMPTDLLYDYFAYRYNAGGFTFWLRPASMPKK